MTRINPYKPTAGGVEYKTMILSTTTSRGSDYHHSEYEIAALNALAKEGWRVVDSSYGGQSRTVFLLERPLQ